MKAKILLFSIIFSTSIILAQNSIYSFSIKDKELLTKELQVVIGEGWEIKDIVFGDITNDKKTDMVVIGNSISDKWKNRKIFLFLNQGKSFFKIAATNETIIGCETCGGAGVGDPYQKTVIAKNSFSFESLCGSCDKDHTVTTFKFDIRQKCWFLSKDITEVTAVNKKMLMEKLL